MTLPVPAAPVLVKATHFSLELCWEDNYQEIVQTMKIASGRLKVCLQQQDDDKNWGAVYNGYSKRHIVTGLEPKTPYTFRIRFQNENDISQWSSSITFLSLPQPLTGEQLHKAVRDKDVAALMKIIESGDVSIDVPDSLGFTALMSSSQKGSAELVQCLLEHGADVNMQNDAGKTALMLACYAGFLDIVKILRKFGAKYDIFDKGGSSALHWAVDGGSEKLIEWIIDDGCDVNMKDSHSGWTPLLRCASVSGNRNIALALLMKGADLNLQDRDGKTALMVAIINSHLPLVELLLQRRADLLIKNEYGKNAYDMAVSTDKQRIIKILDEHCEKYKINLKH